MSPAPKSWDFRSRHSAHPAGEEYFVNRFFSSKGVFVHLCFDFWGAGRGIAQLVDCLPACVKAQIGSPELLKPGWVHVCKPSIWQSEARLLESLRLAWTLQQDSPLCPRKITSFIQYFEKLPDCCLTPWQSFGKEGNQSIEKLCHF